MSRHKIYYLSLAILLAISTVVFSQVKKDSEFKIPQLEVRKTDTIGSQASYYCNFADSSCDDLEKYFSENELDRNIFIDKIDIIKNPEREREMDLQASGCGLEKNQYGTPFLFTKGKCYVGREEIRKYFEKMAEKK